MSHIRFFLAGSFKTPFTAARSAASRDGRIESEHAARFRHDRHVIQNFKIGMPLQEVAAILKKRYGRDAVYRIEKGPAGNAWRVPFKEYPIGMDALENSTSKLTADISSNSEFVFYSEELIQISIPLPKMHNQEDMPAFVDKMQNIYGGGIKEGAGGKYYVGEDKQLDIWICLNTIHSIFYSAKILDDLVEERAKQIREQAKKKIDVSPFKAVS